MRSPSNNYRAVVDKIPRMYSCTLPRAQRAKDRPSCSSYNARATLHLNQAHNYDDSYIFIVVLEINIDK